MIKGLSEIISKSRIQKNNLYREKKFLSWDKIEKVALIIDDKNPINKNKVDEFLQKTNKYVEVYYVELNSQIPSFSDWNCFYKKNQNILKLPKIEVISGLKLKKFDLVINACCEPNLFIANLSSCFSATIKCTANHYLDDFDLMIEREESIDLIGYLENVIKYLRMIKPAA